MNQTELDDLWKTDKAAYWRVQYDALQERLGIADKALEKLYAEKAALGREVKRLTMLLDLALEKLDSEN